MCAPRVTRHTHVTMVTCVCVQELEYRIDVCRVTRGEPGSKAC